MESKTSEAWNAVSNMEYAFMGSDEEGADYYEDILKSTLEEIVIAINLVLELLGLQSLLSQFNEEINKYKNDNKDKLHQLTSGNFGDLTY